MKYFSFILIILLFSCQDNKSIKFTISNKSQQNFDSIVITGIGELKFQNVKNGATVSGNINYLLKSGGNDGAFQIKLSNQNKSRQEIFGYYSNGLPSKNEYTIKIEKDSLIIN